MTDFKAPPPPPEDFAPDSQEGVTSSENESIQEEMPQTQEVSQVSAQGNVVQQNLGNLQEKGTELKEKFNALPERKKLVLIAACMFVLGVFFGAIFFGGGETPAPAPQGLQGVVSNPDVKAGVKRCGRQESPSRACVLYIMNNYDYDKPASDFFESAVILTKRSNFKIQSDNMHYRTTRIPPGHFAQIFIPAVD